MKSFLLRFKGTIFSSAQIQKMTTKMSEKFMWSTFTGRLIKFELKNPPWDFHGWKETCSFKVANRLWKALFRQFILQIFFGFRFLTRVPMGKYLPVWALYVINSKSACLFAVSRKGAPSTKEHHICGSKIKQTIFVDEVIYLWLSVFGAKRARYHRSTTRPHPFPRRAGRPA